MTIKKILLILLLAFVGAGVWQKNNIENFYKDNIDLSWLSFKQTDYGAERVKYMEQQKGEIRIALVPPDADYTLGRAFFDKMVRGVEIASNEIREKNSKTLNLEHFIVTDREKYDTLDECVYKLGTDPSVLAMVLPTSQGVTQQIETLAEYMGIVTFRTTHLFSPREEESYLIFNNTYPVDLYSKIISSYARKRNLQSVAMVTENNPRDNGFTRNVETWLAKQNVPITTALTFEEEMINMSIFKEFEKKFNVLGVDGVFWGMLGSGRIRFISEFFANNTDLMKSADHIMFLPIAPDNIESISAMLQLPEIIDFDPLIAYPHISESPLKMAFDETYFNIYGVKANHAAYYGYDTFMLIANAVRNCEESTLSPQAIAKYLEENSFQGILANYSFDKNGSLQQDVLENVIKIGKIEEGKIREIDLDKVEEFVSRKELWESLEFSLDR